MRSFIKSAACFDPFYLPSAFPCRVLRTHEGEHAVAGRTGEGGASGRAVSAQEGNCRRVGLRSQVECG